MMPDSADREKFEAALLKARTGGKRFRAQFRVERNNRITLLSSEGKTLYNSGEPLIIGVLKEASVPSGGLSDSEATLGVLQAQSGGGF
jgi:hypothetical protein